MGDFMSRYHIYTDARHPSGTLAAGSLLSIYGDAAMTALIPLYADETTGTTLENPYTVPITGICNFWVEDVTPWVLAESDTTPHPIYVNISAGDGMVSVKDYGATGDGVTDDSSEIQAAIDSRGTDGGIVLFPPGIYHLHTRIDIPAGNTARLVLSGHGATILPAATASPCLSTAYAEVDAIFRHMTVEGFEIDCTNLSSLSEIFVVLFGANPCQSFEDWIVRDMRIHSLHTHASDYILPFAFYGLAPDGASEHHIHDVLIERVRIEGGNYGFHVCAYPTPAPGFNINYSIDRVTMRDCYHSTGLSMPPSMISDSFQVGGHAKVGTILLESCYSDGAGDCGFEINNATNAILRNCTANNSRLVAFFMTDFGPPLNSEKSHIRLDGCSALYTGTSRAIASDYAADTCNLVEIVNCRSVRELDGPLEASPGPVLRFSSGAHVDRIYIENFSNYLVVSTASNVAGGKSKTLELYGVGTTELVIRGFYDYVRVGGTVGNPWTHHSIVPQGEDLRLDIDGVVIDAVMSHAIELFGVRLAEEQLTPIVFTGGRIANVRATNLSGSALNVGIDLGYVVAPNVGKFVVQDCDFTMVPSTGYGIRNGYWSVDSLTLLNNREPLA